MEQIDQFRKWQTPENISRAIKKVSVTKKIINQKKINRSHNGKEQN